MLHNCHPVPTSPCHRRIGDRSIPRTCYWALAEAALLVVGENRILGEKRRIFVNEDCELKRHAVISQNNVARIFVSHSQNPLRTAVESLRVPTVHFVREEVKS